jgi:hypothetical protein
MAKNILNGNTTDPHSRTQKVTINLPFTFPPALDAADDALNRSMQETDEPFGSEDDAVEYFRLKCAEKLVALRDLTDEEIAEACRVEKEERQALFKIEKAAKLAEEALKKLRDEEIAKEREEKERAEKIKKEQEDISARFAEDFKCGGTKEAAESKAQKKKAKKAALIAAAAGSESDANELQARRERRTKGCGDMPD